MNFNDLTKISENDMIMQYLICLKMIDNKNNNLEPSKHDYAVFYKCQCN